MCRGFTANNGDRRLHSGIYYTIAGISCNSAPDRVCCGGSGRTVAEAACRLSQSPLLTRKVTRRDTQLTPEHLGHVLLVTETHFSCGSAARCTASQ